MTQREIASEIALACLNPAIPYIWGGKDFFRDKGFDCSGFCQWVLGQVGALPLNPPINSGAMWKLGVDRSLVTQTPKEGCLVFFGAGPTQVSHVMYCLSESVLIGAVEAGSKVTTPALAEKIGAKTESRPISYRKDIVGIIDFFSAIGA